MGDPTAFYYSNELLNYHFNENHPFNSKRLELTIDLIEKSGIAPSQYATAPFASEEDLRLVHDASFIAGVKRASCLAPQLDDERFGVGTDDTPSFFGMHEAASAVVGATLEAAKQVASGEILHAVNLAGGLHHAHQSFASGFCVYNDAAVAIAYLRKHFGMRVAYIDTDAHHGDGVQALFYNDPEVLTISLHETGKYLYPGTGFIEERGEGPGYGYSFNLPLEAFTEDESFIQVLDTCLPTLLHKFKPDILIAQSGCDAHTYDPLTHLCVSTKTYQYIPKLIHRLAHEICGGKLVMIGGGGYDIWRVVPRAWTLLWSEISEQPLPKQIPEEWIQTWQPISPVELPHHWLDPTDSFMAVPRRGEIEERNAINARRALYGTPFVL